MIGDFQRLLIGGREHVVVGHAPATCIWAAWPSTCASVREAGGVPIDFNTIMVTDGIFDGHAGMEASLISRETIADPIELAVQGHQLDGVVCIVGCDKPSRLPPWRLARMDIPGCIFYGAPSCPARCPAKTFHPRSVRSYRRMAGSLDDAGLRRKAPFTGAGACGGNSLPPLMAMAFNREWPVAGGSQRCTRGAQ